MFALYFYFFYIWAFSICCTYITARRNQPTNIYLLLLDVVPNKLVKEILYTLGYVRIQYKRKKTILISHIFWRINIAEYYLSNYNNKIASLKTLSYKNWHYYSLLFFQQSEEKESERTREKKRETEKMRKKDRRSHMKEWTNKWAQDTVA